MPLISKRFCHRRSRQCVNNAPSKPAYSIFLGHEIGRELNTMSQWLDEHRDLLGLAACDLSRCAVKATGRQGLPAEAVLRCALLKQYRQLSYQELAFHLEDSASFRAFARLPWSWSPQKIGDAEDDQWDPARDLLSYYVREAARIPVPFVFFRCLNLAKHI